MTPVSRVYGTPLNPIKFISYQTSQETDYFQYYYFQLKLNAIALNPIPEDSVYGTSDSGVINLMIYDHENRKITN